MDKRILLPRRVAQELTDVLNNTDPSVVLKALENKYSFKRFNDIFSEELRSWSSRLSNKSKLIDCIEYGFKTLADEAVIRNHLELFTKYLHRLNKYLSDPLRCVVIFQTEVDSYLSGSNSQLSNSQISIYSKWCDTSYYLKIQVIEDFLQSGKH